MEKKHTIFNETTALVAVRDEVERRFTGLDDLAHGWEHVQRVYTLALTLAAQEAANSFIVGMAALLHDLGRTVGTVSTTHTAFHTEIAHHADLSVSLATELMQAHDVPQEQQEAIVHAIVAHSFSKGVEPRTLEASIVRDADRLDGLGAIGILRWAVTGAVRRTSETRSYHPQDPFGEHHTLDDEHYMIDHFYKKLLKLEETMLTETGRRLARQRTSFMRVYLQELERELNLT